MLDYLFLHFNFSSYDIFHISLILFIYVSSLLFDENKDHKHYFCSSLVAKLYKKLGLLSSVKSCKQYLPSSFASGDNMQLYGDGPYGYCFLED